MAVLKRTITFLLLVCMVGMTACSSQPKNKEVDTKIEGNQELYSYIVEQWKKNEIEPLYEYAGSDLASLMDKENFVAMFMDLSRGEPLEQVSEETQNTINGIEVYKGTFAFENISVDVSLSLKDSKIVGVNYNKFYFTKEFEEKKENNITERCFVLENGEYRLNAVYTYVNDGEKHPTVLLIGGSGPSNFDEMVGLLRPFQDIAEAFAKKGINTLRMDKRTLNYGSEFSATGGIEEEYLLDCRKAMEYLREQQNVGDLYLLGHSLGGQIAAKLAVEEDSVKGVIELNSSARNLVEIACDQYIALDASNKATYESNRNQALAATKGNATGAYYFGASDYYWASLNAVDTIANMKALEVPVLIINSTADAQIMDADIALWKEKFSDDDQVTIYVDDKMSHFVYEIDAKDNTTLYHKVPMPENILDRLTAFVQ